MARNRRAAILDRQRPRPADLAALVRPMSQALSGPRDLDPLIERIGDAHFVLLGEASHGTAEYYTWRAALSRRLVQEKGFSFIAVEGDWPDCYRVNRYIKSYPDSGGSAREVLHGYRRWPTWMWANEEVVALAEWLRHHNDPLPEERKVGFYGLDVYSLWESLFSIMEYLHRVDPASLPAAWKAFRCFEPYDEDVQEYARATRFVPNSCEDEVIDLLRKLRDKAPEYRADGREGYFDAEQNAWALKGAEAYYRTMIRGGADSWNLRDRHMADTLDRIMQDHGPRARAIVWEHNTHIGDARFTDMADEGMFNIGQLARERHEAEGVVLVGFGSHRGSVIAGREWDAPMEIMTVPPAREGTWEDVLHNDSPQDRLLIFRDVEEGSPLLEPRGHRAIGVVYHPDYERFGNYVPTVLPRRYDAFVYLDETRALHPLHMPVPQEREVPETYPSGV